jgi:hypothetical protein
MLPVSINGIGLRENALAAMLGWYGVAAADAVALAWLVYLSSLLLGMIGGIVYAVRRAPPTPDAGTQGDRYGLTSADARTVEPTSRA